MISAKAFVTLLKKGMIYPGLLVIAAILTHLQWFNPFTNLFFNDWRYRTNEAVAQIFPFGMSSWLSFSGFGSQNIQPYTFIPTFIWGLIGNYSIATKITHFIPIAVLSLLAPYFLLKKISFDRKAAFLGALFFGFNTYLISRSFAHLSIAIVNVLLPLILCVFINFIKKKNWKDAIEFSLLFTIGCVYEIRVMYIVTFVLLVFSGFHLDDIFKSFRKHVAKYVLVAILILTLNIFWLFVVAKAGTSAIAAVANRGIWGSGLTSILNALSLSDWSWTMGVYEPSFTPHPILPYLWVLPLLAFVALLFKQGLTYSNKRYIAFASIITIVGLLLAKQESVPFSSIYQWLYQYFPGFNLFREASKFTLLIALGYSILITFAISFLQKRISSKKIRGLFLIITCFFALLNAKRIFFQDAVATYVGQVEPPEYRVLSEIIKNDPTKYFRTLWIPFYHQWGYFDLNRPKVSMWEELGQNTNFANLGSIQPAASTFKNPKLYSSVITLPYGQQILSLFAVKYVIVPKQLPKTSENIFPYAGERSEYIKELDNIGFLKRRTIGGIDIYENEFVYSPIFSFKRLVKYSNANNLHNKYNLTRSIWGEDFLFSNEEKTNDKEIRSLVTDLFEDIDFSNIRKNSLDVNQSVVGDSINTIYSRNDGAYNAVVYLRNGFISVFLQKNGELFINLDKTSSRIPEKKRLLKEWIGSMDGLYVANEGNLQPIINNMSKVFNQIKPNSKIDILKLGQNTVPNPSFESGSWQAVVGDCDNRDSSPDLGMSLNTEQKTDRRQSLQLNARRHVACVSTKADIVSKGDYLFAFDYQSNNAKKYGYYLAFNDPAKTVIKETANLRGKEWQTYLKRFQSPEGATTVKIYLYSYSIDQITNVSILYDNVRLAPINKIRSYSIPKLESFTSENVKPLSGKNEISYVSSNYEYSNIMDNPSFESGLWQAEVGDCNRYDQNGLLRMSTTTTEKTDGQVSLELGATRHTACTSMSVPVKSGSTYLVRFDYQSPNAKSANYYIGFNDPAKTSLKEELPIKNQDWQTFSQTITVPAGATSLSLYVYAKESDKKTEIINRYDNFKLIEVPDLKDAFYLVSEPTSTLVEPKSISFDLINPTKKQVHIKGATTPFFLGMSESYHDQWQLQMRNQKMEGGLNRWSPFAKPDRVADAYHYKLDGFLNAWYVDTNEVCAKEGVCTKNPDGSYDIEMTIEFWPQRWFYLGLLISGTTLAGCLGYLAFYGINVLRRKRREKTTV